MPYKGDYYGDYYRGDPGIFSSIGKFLGGAAKTVIGAITNPVGTAVSVGGGLLTRSAAPTPPLITSGFSSSLPIFSQPPVFNGGGNVPVPAGTPGAQPVPGIGGAISRFLPGGETGYQLPGGGRGLHLNKAAYVTRGGGTSRWGSGLQLHEKGTVAVRNRRMNPANPKALRRAIRRTRGAVKLLRKAAGSCGYSVVTKASLARRPKARRR